MHVSFSSNDWEDLLHNWTEVQWYQALSGDAEKKEAIGLYSSVLRADAGIFTQKDPAERTVMTAYNVKEAT